jgi:hypothetical protein
MDKKMAHSCAGAEYQSQLFKLVFSKELNLFLVKVSPKLTSIKRK